MKKICLLLMLMIALPIFSADADLTKSKGVVHRMESKVTSASSEVKEKQYVVYQKRVKLELALKRLDKEFAEVHTVYADKRKVHSKDPKNEGKKKAYYNEMAKMVELLLEKSIKNKKVEKPLRNYVSQLNQFRRDVGKQLNKSEQKKYVAACKVVDKFHGIN